MTAPGGTATLEAWALVRQMLDDMTAMVQADAETELELLEGLRVLGRATALCSELSLDVDGESPWFFSMNTEARLIGGPNPDGEYHLAMIDGAHRYRVSGRRGTVCYLGFQVLAGTGLTPRRMAAYVSDTDLEVADDGTLRVRARRRRADRRPSWPAHPGCRSPRTRRPSSCASTSPIGRPRPLAELAIAPLDPVGVPAAPTDDVVAEQLTAMAWTIAKLTTLHRTIRPELLDQPNELATAEAADLGSADTTPDNLYMLGHLPPGRRRGPGHRHRTARHPLLERDPREHLARVHRRPAPAQLAHQRPRRPRPTGELRVGSGSRQRCGSSWPPPIRACPTGSTPAAATAGS